MNKLKIKDRDQDIEEYLVYGEKSIQKFIKEEASLNYKITKKEKKGISSKTNYSQIISALQNQKY